VYTIFLNYAIHVLRVRDLFDR